MLRFFRRCLFVASLCAALLNAQEYRGRIQGTVTDSSSAIVAGAQVTLINTATDVSMTKATSATGHYLFDVVEPGVYRIIIELLGFTKFEARNVQLQQRGDVTVDARLTPGSVSETVTVSAEASQIQFNTSKLETTVDARLAASLPQYHRDPFFLSKLDPTVVQSETSSEMKPFNSTSAPTTQNVGGAAATAADLQVDGAPIGLGRYAGYIPSPDMVAEVNVQQNAVDAEFGNSAGSAISVLLKSGTNELHGLAFYQGMYPWANAIADRVNRTVNVGRNHIFGGTFSHAIKRNRWFNFVAFEGWQQTDPQTLRGQLPTDLERRGDFSQSLNGSGALRVIYDPWTTSTSADGRTVTRTAFPNNIIPSARISRVASMYNAVLPQPTSAGTGPYRALNYVVPAPPKYPYRNFSDRTDFVINDKLRYGGRVSLFRTPATVTNPTGDDLVFTSERGSDRDATQISNEITWAKNANTVISGSFVYYGFNDRSHPRTNWAEEVGYAKMWPNNPWYETMFKSKAFPQLPPGMEIRHGNNAWITESYAYGLGANGPYWIKTPRQDAENLKISQQRGSHYLKTGFESRGNRSAQVQQISIPAFMFDATSTASTYLNPNTSVSGDGYASFLIGAYNNLSRGDGMPVRVPTKLLNRTFSGYVNDDWKVNRRITLNLGLRYEYEQPFHEEQNRMARIADLSVPIPELQGANAPQMPAVVRQYYDGPWTFKGAFRWADDGSRGLWSANRGILSPRAGIALRVNDKTAVRFGWGRFSTPWLASTDMTLGAYYYGFNVQTPALPFVQGVPQLHLDDPFPASYPIQDSTGKGLGPYAGLGDNLAFFSRDTRFRQNTNRFNLSVQRQLPFDIRLELTGLLSYSNGIGSRNINQTDPRIAYTYKAATNVQVANPFYNLLPANKFPGPLGRQATVSLSQLMRPYPQYGNLTVTDYEDNGGSRYEQLAVKVQKNYSHGLTFTSGYAYLRQRSLAYYDDVATFLQQRTWQEGANPRHRITMAGNWEVPVGHRRAYLSALPRVLDAVIGGWNISPLMTWRSGNYISFGGLVATGDPRISNPGPSKWFNTAVFSQLPAFTQRSNPVTYSGLTGPGYFNLDLSLVKSIRVTEKLSAEMRIDTFNAPNTMTWNDPSTTVTSTFFGISSGQLNANGVGVGRQTQLGLRVRF